MKRLFIFLMVFVLTWGVAEAQRPLSVSTRLPYLEKTEEVISVFGIPPAGRIYTYAKEDGRLYTLNSDSTEMLLGAISGANPQDTTVSGTSATITHSLGYYPTVWFINGSGVTFTGDSYLITHSSENEFVVTFGESVTNMTIVYGRGGTSYFSYTIISVSSFSITHNFGFYPYVLFRASDGVISTANNYLLTHSSKNAFTATFGETVDTLNVIWR